MDNKFPYESETAIVWLVSAMGKDVDYLPMVKSVSAINYSGIRRDCAAFIANEAGDW